MSERGQILWNTMSEHGGQWVGGRTAALSWRKGRTTRPVLLLLLAVGLSALLTVLLFTSRTGGMAPSDLAPTGSESPSATTDVAERSEADVMMSPHDLGPELLAVETLQEATVLEVEPWRQLRLDELDRHWNRIQEQLARGPEVEFEDTIAVLYSCLRPLLDELGMAQLIPQGYRTVPSRPGHHHVTINDSEYYVPHGMLPVLDRHRKLTSEQIELQESHRLRAAEHLRQGGRQSELPRREPFVPDEEFLQQLEELHRQAFDAVKRRPYIY